VGVSGFGCKVLQLLWLWSKIMSLKRHFEAVLMRICTSKSFRNEEIDGRVSAICKQKDIALHAL
jgi:hypothetical protein